MPVLSQSSRYRMCNWSMPRHKLKNDLSPPTAWYILNLLEIYNAASAKMMLNAVKEDAVLSAPLWFVASCAVKPSRNSYRPLLLRNDSSLAHLVLKVKCSRVQKSLTHSLDRLTGDGSLRPPSSICNEPGLDLQLADLGLLGPTSRTFPRQCVIRSVTGMRVDNQTK